MSSHKSFELIFTPGCNMTAEMHHIAELTGTDPSINHKENKLTGITNLPEPVRNMLKTRGVIIKLVENKN